MKENSLEESKIICDLLLKPAFVPQTARHNPSSILGMFGVGGEARDQAKHLYYV